MAVVNTLSTNVTAADAAPVTQVPVAVSGGVVRQIIDTVAVAAADDDTSTFRVARVHSSWRITSIKIFNDAITSGTSYDLGLYQTAANGGAVVDVDAYGSAIDLSSARTTAPLEAAFEARNITAIQQTVFQDAGLTTDSNRFYDLVLTANTIGSAAGDITVIVQYTID